MKENSGYIASFQKLKNTIKKIKAIKLQYETEMLAFVRAIF